jgi:hypothetical protein
MLTGPDGMACFSPVTATLPVVPGRVHSGVPSFSGAAVGHTLAGVAVSVTEDVTTSATEGVLAGEVSVSEPHAASVMTNDAAQATSATAEDTREVFTVVTLQPHPALLARGPAMSTMGPRARHHVPRENPKPLGGSAPRGPLLPHINQNPDSVAVAGFVC